MESSNESGKKINQSPGDETSSTQPVSINDLVYKITPNKQEKIFSVPSEDDIIEGLCPFPDKDSEKSTKNVFTLTYLALFKKIKTPDETTRKMLVNLIQTGLIQGHSFETIKERFFKTFQSNINDSNQ